MPQKISADQENYGLLVYDESGIIEMKRKKLRAKAFRATLGVFFLVMSVIFFLWGASSEGWRIEIMRFNALYLGVPFMLLLGIALILDAISVANLKVYENGISFPFRRYHKAIQRKEDFVTFHDIQEIAITPGKVLLVKGEVNLAKERPIYKRDIHSIEKFLKSIEGKVEITRAQ